MNELSKKLDLKNKVIVILSNEINPSKVYANEIIKSKGFPVIIYIKNNDKLKVIKTIKNKNYEILCISEANKNNLKNIKDKIIRKHSKIDALINRISIVPGHKITKKMKINGFLNEPENYPIEIWEKNIKFILNNIFLSCQIFGKIMILRNSQPFASN